MKKPFAFLVVALVASFGSFALTPMEPSSGALCPGAAIYINDSLSPGGTWSSSAPAIGSINPTGVYGTLTGISSGIVTITYTLGGSYVTGTFTVSPAPAAITGSISGLCPGSTTTLTDATPGGTWSCTPGWVATIGSSTGVLTAIANGTATVNYYVGGGCPATTTIIIDGAPSGYIEGDTIVCVGSTITLTDTSSYPGTWSSSNPVIATVGGTTGIVTGVSGGTVTISLTTTGVCGASYATWPITVSGSTNAGTITGMSSVAEGNTINLSNPTASVGTYTWTSSVPAMAAVGSSTGIVAGVSVGSATITYSLSGCGGLAYTTTTVNVTTFDGISGHIILGSGGYLFGDSMRVWLISYNPITLDLEAQDSNSYFFTDTSVYYQFPGIATDSYRVKAAIFNDSGFMFMPTGYIPTYHTSHFYWYDADVILHNSGVADINRDITMSIGTPTSGPGFIGGNVMTGANKGTAGTVPVQGMKMCIVNSGTSQLMGAAYTNASGNYSFSNLPVGQTYYVFPDSLNYKTTPYTSVSLTTSSPTMTAASFVQHTLSKTITPTLTGVQATQTNATSIASFPNPTTGQLNIRWFDQTAEVASIVITDIAGRELYNTNINFSAGTGMKQIDLSGWANGTYIVTVKTATISYNSKIEVVH